MGIKYAHQLTYGINQLSLKDLYKVAMKRMPVDNQNRCTRQRPSIDIDCSLLIRTRGNNNIGLNTKYLLDFCRVHQLEGFDVMVVFDGNHRHHSKRSTIQRQSENDRKRIELIINKSILMHIVQQRRLLDSIEERDKLLEEEVEVKKIRTIERCLQQTTIDVGDTLYKSFNSALQKRTNNDNICSCQAVFQVDSVMAGRVVSGQTDILVTSDSYQAALLGERCVCIKKFKFKAGKKTTNRIIRYFYCI
jgi:hypothetical protein